MFKEVNSATLAVTLRVLRLKGVVVIEPNHLVSLDRVFCDDAVKSNLTKSKAYWSLYSFTFRPVGILC